MWQNLRDSHCVSGSILPWRLPDGLPWSEMETPHLVATEIISGEAAAVKAPPRNTDAHYIYTVRVCVGVECNFPLFPNRHPLTSKSLWYFFFLVFSHHGRQLILVPVSPISSQNDQLLSIDPRNQRLYFTLALTCFFFCLFFFAHQQTLTGQGRGREEKKKVLWHSWKDKSAEKILDRRRERRGSEGRETQR